MKKFFKSLAVVLALALVITSVPATAASAASVSLKSKTVTLYSEPSTGKTEDGKVCKSYNFWKIAKLLNNFDAETMDIKLVSEDTDLVQKSNKKDMIWVADGASFGTTKVKVIVTSLSTEKVLLEKSITVKVKKNATEDTFKCDLENGSEFEVGETVAVTLSRKNTDTDARKLTCADDSVEIVDANGYGTKYNVTFTKAGKFTLVASAYQSAKYPAPTVEKEIEVVVTSDFAASATGAKEITVIGSGLTKDITVKRNNVTVSADSVVPSEDGTTAVITLASKITDATYVVTFGEQTAEFVGEKQRVDDIVVVENGASVTTGTITGFNLLYVHYDVLDQYGDSVRKNYPVTWNASIGEAITAGDVDTANGEIVIRVKEDQPLYYGASVILNGTYIGSGVAETEQATFTVGLPRNLDTVEPIGVIKLSTKEFVDILPAGFAADEYAIVFDCLDQNGNKLDAEVYSVDANLSFASMNAMVIQGCAAAESLTIGDTMYGIAKLIPGVQAANGGVADIRVLSKKTGSPSTISVEVDSAQVIDSFIFFAPDDIVAEGEKDIPLEYEALDTNGNKVTNFNALVKSVYFTNTNIEFVKQDDASAKLIYDTPYVIEAGNVVYKEDIATDNFDYPDTIMAIVRTNGTSYPLTISVKEKAKAVAVYSIKADTDILENGGSFEIKTGDMKFIDQYDRVGKASSSDLTLKINSDKIKVDIGGKVAAIDAPNKLYRVTGNFTIDVAPGEIVSTSETAYFVLGLTNLVNGQPVTLSGSEKTFSATVYDITQCTSFALSADNSMLKYDADVTGLSVTGKLRDGGTVKVPEYYYAVADTGSDKYDIVGGKVDPVGYNIIEDLDPSTGSAIYSDFVDYSKVNADGSRPSRNQTFTVVATVYDREAATGGAIARETIKCNITTSMDDYKDIEITTSGDSFKINANEGNITPSDLLKKAGVQLVSNYASKNTSFGSGTDYDEFVSKCDGDQIFVTVSKLTENLDAGTPALTIGSNGENNNNDAYILTNAEMGDTFVATFTVNGLSKSVTFEVGADKDATYTNDSKTGDSTWF